MCNKCICLHHLLYDYQLYGHQIVGMVGMTLLFEAITKKKCQACAVSTPIFAVENDEAAGMHFSEFHRCLMGKIQ